MSSGQLKWASKRYMVDVQQTIFMLTSSRVYVRWTGNIPLEYPMDVRWASVYWVGLIAVNV